MDLIPVKQIRIVYHIFQKDDGSGNIPDNSTGRQYINNLHDKANDILANLEPMTFPSSSGFIPDAKIQYHNMGIYFYQSTSMWMKGDRFSSTHGTSMYNYIMQYNFTGKNNSIHILIPGNFGSDSGASGRASWFGCAKWTMLEDVYYRYTINGNFWSIASVLNHEIGHNCTLYHVFDPDRCNDTNGHPSNFTSSSIDNNMMGYNGGQNSLTEDQITRWHHYLQEESNVLLYSSIYRGSLECFLSQSGSSVGPISPTTNAGSSNATLTVQGSGLSNITWVKTSGSGNFTVSNNGQTVSLSGLGSILLTVSWEENCVNLEKSYVLYYQPSY